MPASRACRRRREAARIDGANALKMHLWVIIPTMRGIIGFVCLITIMDVLRTFDSLIPLSPQADAIGNESIMFYVFDNAFRDGSRDWDSAVRSTCSRSSSS